MQNNVFPKDCSRLTFNFVFGNTGKEAMFLIYLWQIIIYTGDKREKNKNFKADGKLPERGLSARMKGWRPTWPFLLTPQGKYRSEAKVHISENISHL